MLLTTFFDTHESIKILTKAGFTEEQAEGQIKVITGLIEDTLASKKDLKELEIALRTDMKKMEASLKNALPGADQANLLNLLGYHLKKCAFFVLYRSFWHQKGSLSRAYVQVRGKCFLEQKPNQWPKPM
jgi:hypothetical protein